MELSLNCSQNLMYKAFCHLVITFLMWLAVYFCYFHAKGGSLAAVSSPHKRTELQQKGAAACSCGGTWHYCNQKSRRPLSAPSSSARCSTLVSSANRLTMKNLGDERETLVTGRNGTMASGRRVMGASWSSAFFAPVRKYPDFYPG